MSVLVASIGFGLVTASILALAAVGFTLQFGITNVLNLAFGNIMTAGASIAYLANRAGINIWFCIILAAVFAALFSMVLNRVLISPFLHRGTKPFGMVILTLALGIMIQNTILAIGGINFFSYNLSPGFTLKVGPLFLTESQLGIIAIAVVGMVALHVLLNRTKLGKAMRATSSDASLARACGIRTGRVTDVAWLISGAFCGIAGVTLVMNTTTFQASTGNDFLVVIIAAAVLGGVGQPYGAMLGALVIGLVTEISAAILDPAYKNVIAFGLLVVVLIFRPQGLIAQFRTQPEPQT
jgi:branched-subunit amino acid ABC-type transport system permease component